MAIDRAEFATVCVREGLNCGINPHYLLGVAQLRSGISEGSQNGEIGPFRLTQAQWDANRTDDEFAFDYLSQDINEWDMQCAVFALMAHRAFDAFALANNRDPSARELYLQQWPAAPTAMLSADLQAALDATAALVDPAAAGVPNASPSMPPKIDHPDQPVTRVAIGGIPLEIDWATRSLKFPGAEMSSPAPLTGFATVETKSPPQLKELVILKPTFMGMSLDLKELFRRAKELFRRAKAWWKHKK